MPYFSNKPAPSLGSQLPMPSFKSDRDDSTFKRTMKRKLSDNTSEIFFLFSYLWFSKIIALYFVNNKSFCLPFRRFSCKATCFLKLICHGNSWNLPIETTSFAALCFYEAWNIQKPFKWRTFYIQKLKAIKQFYFSRRFSFFSFVEKNKEVIFICMCAYI